MTEEKTEEVVEETVEEPVKDTDRFNEEMPFEDLMKVRKEFAAEVLDLEYAFYSEGQDTDTSPTRLNVLRGAINIKRGLVSRLERMMDRKRDSREFVHFFHEAAKRMLDPSICNQIEGEARLEMGEVG